MQKVLDTKKIQGRSLADLDPAELNSLMLGAEEEAAQEVKDEDATLTLGAIGAPYQVGPIDVTVALGNLVLLNEIDSPFLNGDIGEEGSELDATECIKSLYVLAEGREAIRPVMAIKQRIQSLMLLKPMVDKNPDLFDKLMDRTDDIALAHADFELDAMEWYNQNFVGWDFQDVIDDMMMAFNDIMKSAENMPTSDEKKSL